MPLSTLLEAPRPVYVQEWCWPRVFANLEPGVGPTPNSALGTPGGFAPASTRDITAISAGAVASSATYGLASNQDVLYYSRKSRLAARLRSNTTGQSTGAAIVPLMANTCWEDGAQAPGARVAASSAVWVMDFHLDFGLSGAAPSWDADASGILFFPTPSGTITNVQAAPPGHGSQVGGCGMFINDVGGVASAEWVSWLQSGAILERLTVPGVSFTQWNTIRCILITAASGRPATISLAVNGASPVLTREFGSAQLGTPNQMCPAGQTANALAAGVAASGPSLESVYVVMSAKWGRFTPDGIQVQTP